jgi:twitching motility protein PilU
MILDKLFQVMADRQASDIFICAGAPIHIKIQGNTVPVNQQVMDSAMIAEDRRRTDDSRAGQRLRGDEGDEPLVRRTQARQFPHQLLFQQRASAIVIRYIPGNIPALDSLLLPPVLADLVMEKRGLILMVGATGSGKSTTLASMLDHRNEQCSGHILTIEDPIEFLFKHKKSHRQPARGRHRHPGLGQRAEKRHAPGARLHPDRRNPRPGNHAGGHRLRPVRPPLCLAARCTPTTATTRSTG